MMAALGRSAHLIHRGPRAILADWMAWPLVGADADAILAGARPVLGQDEIPFVAWFAARNRLAEDWLAASGAEQYVVLGAGLDSFAWRQTGSVRVFEVDHPSTQAWKAARAEAIGAPVPTQLVRVPVDFERERLGPALTAAGLDAARPVFVSWLGVIPYLTPDAIAQTLSDLPSGCSLAVGYVPPTSAQDIDAQRLGAFFEAQVAELGEPYLTTPTRSEFADFMAENRFIVVEDIGAHDIEGRYGLRALNHERMALARKDA
jgi:methyltransferase (TIGR00027 family)